MRLIIFFAFILSVFFVNAQVVFDKTKFDLGDLNALSDRYIDVKLTNHSQKKAYVLTIKKPADVVYVFTNQTMEKDSSLILRFQVNPSKKGKFSYDVEIFLSDKSEPSLIKLVGNVKELPPDESTFLRSCPDFNSKPSDKNTNDFELTVLTIDKKTKELLPSSSVIMIQNGQTTGEFKTDEKGRFKKKFPLGFTYFYAEHLGYEPTEMGAYVNFQRNYIVLELNKKEEQINTVALSDKKEDKEVTELTKTPNEITEFKTDNLANNLNELDKNQFDNNNFKPVNVVFVLDISSSMNIGDKMELMKYSLSQLAQVLRPQDQISIVTYATTASVLLDNSHGNQKEEIINTVQDLKALGVTAGGDGIKLGYKTALKHFLQDGVNQVIVITDGAFNRNSGNYQKIILKYEKKGISLSVVGIQNSDKDKVKMEEVANLAKGRYIPIYKLIDAQNNLIQEIRYISFKGK